jgi:hypothetical protein
MLNKTTGILNYNRRYIRTGSSAPVFHIMLTLFSIGVLVEAKGHHARIKDGGGH